MDTTVEAITYSPPEEVDVVDSRTKKTVRTCRVPVRENRKLMGYIPLPMRYREAWLELSYYIVMYTNVWRLWAEEEEKARRKPGKEKAAILRQNAGTQVVQHTHSRLLTILELVSWSHDTKMPGAECVHTLNEWKIRLSRDWFNVTYAELLDGDDQFLCADPIRPENKSFFGEFFLFARSSSYEVVLYLEMNWNLDDEGKGLLSLPDDLGDWFDGDVRGLNQTFRDIIKPQALAALKAKDFYFQTQFDDKAKLPARWHEGQQPRPYFWSVKLWDWVAKGGVADILYGARL